MAFEKINEKLGKKHQIKQEIIETQFIRATRHDGQTGLRGALSRGEFTNVLLRVCAAICRDKGKEVQVSDNLSPFLDKVLLDMFNTSPV